MSEINSGPILSKSAFRNSDNKRCNKKTISFENISYKLIKRKNKNY